MYLLHINFPILYYVIPALILYPSYCAECCNECSYVFWLILFSCVLEVNTKKFKLLGYRISPILLFWETFMPFSLGTEPGYICISSEWNFFFLHITATLIIIPSICFFLLLLLFCIWPHPAAFFGYSCFCSQKLFQGERAIWDAKDWTGSVACKENDLFTVLLFWPCFVLFCFSYYAHLYHRCYFSLLHGSHFFSLSTLVSFSLAEFPFFPLF